MRGTFVALAASCQGQGDSGDKLRSCPEVSATWRSPQGTRCWWLSVPGPSHLAAAPRPPASCTPPATLLGTAGASQLQPGNYKTLQSAAGEKQELLQQLPEGPALDSQDFPGLGLARKGFIHLGGAVKTKIKFFISEREGGEGRKCLTSLPNALLEAKGLRGTWGIYGCTCGTPGVLPQILHGGAMRPGPSGPLPSGHRPGWGLCGCQAFVSILIQKRTASPVTPPCAPHGSARPQHAPTPLGFSQGLVLRTTTSPGARLAATLPPRDAPSTSRAGPFPPCRKRGGAAPPACAGKAGSRALAAIPAPELAAGLRLLSLLPTFLRWEKRFVCKCMWLK
nr:uncharacterized protein LOC106032058 [Anser cygnoides]XP_047915518.1 uncharacterized protein LOC106032058 [Anser cygnoides]